MSIRDLFDIMLITLRASLGTWQCRSVPAFCLPIGVRDAGVDLIHFYPTYLNDVKSLPFPCEVLARAVEHGFSSGAGILRNRYDGAFANVRRNAPSVVKSDATALRSARATSLADAYARCGFMGEYQ